MLIKAVISEPSLEGLLFFKIPLVVFKARRNGKANRIFGGHASGGCRLEYCRALPQIASGYRRRKV